MRLLINFMDLAVMPSSLNTRIPNDHITRLSMTGVLFDLNHLQIMLFVRWSVGHTLPLIDDSILENPIVEHLVGFFGGAKNQDPRDELTSITRSRNILEADLRWAVRTSGTDRLLIDIALSANPVRTRIVAWLNRPSRWPVS
jgi:hypothetical protein